MKKHFRFLVLITGLLGSFMSHPLHAMAGKPDQEADLFRPLPLSGVLAVVDLASDNEWMLRLDDGPERPVKVPGGGWNSDQQSPPIQVMREVKDFVRYTRTITVPASAGQQVVQLRFGAANYGCEVFLDGRKAGEHHGPHLPFSIDLTPHVRAGEKQQLEIKVYHRRHYIAKDSKRTAEVAVGFDCSDGDDAASRAEAKEWCGWNGNTKLAYGIAGSLQLVVLPAVHVEDIFIRPSVTNQKLDCDIWIRNETSETKDLAIDGSLSSSNLKKWTYPQVPTISLKIPARTTMKVALPAMDWKLGRDSFWWPNIPFREDYLAQLHCLNLNIKEGDKVWQKFSRRFGFVEHGEGLNYYTVNGVRYTGLGDATAESQLSFYDAYNSPAWLPPTKPGTGAPESWRRYLRVGINIKRLLCSPPTEYMMQAADEVGFLLIPEAPIWGNGLSRYSPTYTPQTFFDMGRACRNHPSVARYSLTNEVREKRDEQWPWRAAIDHIREVDDSRPLVYELHALGGGKVEGFKGGHAWIMEHYTDIHEKLDPAQGIRGMGENFWHTNMGSFAVGMRTLRVNGWCYMAGWSWANYWPNFFEGMSHSQHGWKLNNHPDRRDGVDGWGSPILRFTQQSLHPYLIQDVGILDENSSGPVKAGDRGEIRWPYDLPVGVTGNAVERTIVVFNGGLQGNALTASWSFHWDSPDGPVALPGGKVDCTIEPGGQASHRITFKAPALESNQNERLMYIVLQSAKEGKVVFRDESTALRVIAKALPTASATFLGTDTKTRGDWRNRYGAEGHELMGRFTEMPYSRKLRWISGRVVVHEKRTADPRALEFFQNDLPASPSDRIAAARYGKEISLTLDAGNTLRQMTLYSLDWETKQRIQEVEIFDDVTGASLGRQTISEFGSGLYHSWKVQGKIRLTIRSLKGEDASVSGVFIDPDQPFVEKVQ